MNLVTSRPSIGDVLALLVTSRLIRSFVATIVFVAIAVTFVRYAAKTRFFGVFTIVKYPYYARLVADIDGQPAFVRRIGSPIVVDDAGVWCARIDVGAGTSECTLPVSGPRGSGSVLAKVIASGPRLSADLTLHAGNAVVHADESD